MLNLTVSLFLIFIHSNAFESSKDAFTLRSLELTDPVFYYSSTTLKELFVPFPPPQMSLFSPSLTL